MPEKPITILVVDDVDASRYTLSRMLKKAKFVVKEAATGRDALHLAAQKPDLVILDVNLPDISGHEVCKRIKADAATSSIPVMHLSASFVESDNRAEGLEGGADAYLTYPVEQRELLATIEALLRTRRAEQQARDQHELLQVTLSSIGDAVMAADSAGLVTFMNPVAQALTGWAIEDAVGKPLADVFRVVDAQDGHPVEFSMDQPIRAGGAVTTNTCFLTAKDGTQRRIDDSKSPIRDREGRVAGIVLVFRDVTERQRIEEARRQAEERWRLMVESVKDYAFFSTDPQGRITSWNAGAERLFGYAENEILNSPIAKLFTPEDVAGGVPARELAKSAADGRSGDERWHVRKNGSRFFASGVTTPLRDLNNLLIGFTKISRDITERKQAEEEINRLLAAQRQQSEQLRRIAETSLTVNATLTRDSILGVITEEARKIIGAEEALSCLNVNDQGAQTIQSVSRSDNGDDWLTRNSGANGRELSALIYSANRPMRLTSAQLNERPAVRNVHGSDATAPTGGWLAAPFVARDGRNLGLIQLSGKHDGEFTEGDGNVLAQLALIGSVAIQNANLYRELREGDRRKDEFLAILAHELRNPLAPIRNAVKIQRMADNDPGALDRSRRIIERQVEQMVRLIDDLLDLSRISRGRIELRKERIELVEIVNNALESSRPMIETLGHSLKVSLPPNPVHLFGDPTRLTQVLLNLLNNAAKYTDRGGEIRLAAELAGDQVLIRITDTGIGIPPEMLSRIFEMFAQVDRSLERAQGGLGIGLTLVRTLVEMHGGSIEAHSPGLAKGSEFVMRLPRVVDSPLGVASKPLGARAEKKDVRLNLRILVVDDNEDSADSLGILLTIFGSDVTTAKDGRSALETAVSFQPDVVLLDIGLPGVNGYEVAREIRKKRPGGVVLIAVTGLGQEEDRRRSKAAGFDHHLVKPVDPNQLRELLTSIRRSLRTEPASATDNRVD